MKILITGGLGYIGSRLCEAYRDSGDEITVIDNRFIPESVAFLAKERFKYYQLDILDEALIPLIKEADVIYHLAGITNVAYTKSEESKHLDGEIKRVGIEGTNFILKHMREETKLIFPSTHVVFEGHQFTENIEEDFQPNAQLTYSNVKLQNELDIKKKCKNYIILRLASVYGLGNNMRTQILPNLFSKITSQNETIKLFGGGVQLKSLVALGDVVDVMRFMSKSPIKNEIYHVSNESRTVNEVANLCNSIKRVNIIKTDDEIPNKGYSLSNKKLLSTGFKFKCNLESEMRKMISRWSTR